MIYLFDKSDKPCASSVGKKASSLIEMTEAGFNVPKGFVLSVSFFKPWIKEIKKTDLWDKFISLQTKRNCDEIKCKASEFKFNKQQEQEIQKALHSLKDTSIFAVRSSSSEEDLSDASFAGQYDTFLGVTECDIENMVAKVFSSIFDYRVIRYKKSKNIDINNPSIAIIIQEQIASDVSGIAFSVNPYNNCYDEAMINASFGLGESIVSGIITPDVYIADKIESTIIDKKINKKDTGLYLEPNSSTIEKIVKNPLTQAITDKQILSLTNLVTKCEKYYDIPIDIEWAIHNNEIYLLQVRPITTYIPLIDELVTEPGEKKRLYLDIIAISQGFSESMSILGIEVWSCMFQRAKMGMFQEGVDGAVYSGYGKQYFIVSNLAKVLGKRWINRMVERYDNATRRAFESIDLDEYIPDKKPKNMKSMAPAWIKTALVLGPPTTKALLDDHIKVRDIYEKESAAVKESLKEDVNIDRPFDQIVEESMANFDKIMKSIGVLMAGMVASSSLNKMFKDYDVEDEIVKLSMDLYGNPTSAMGHAMYSLACYDEIQYTNCGEEFERKIKNNSYSKSFMDEYNEYMYNYGARGFKEIDIGTKRTYEDLPSFFKQLTSINIKENRFINVTKRRDEAYNKLYDIAKENGFEKKFKKTAATYMDIFGFREDGKYVYVLAVSQLRRAALKIGNIFVKEGRLDNKEQIFDLNIEQIVKAQSEQSFDLNKARENNLRYYKKTSHIKDWPALIDSRGKIIKAKPDIKDGDLVGDAISPGVVTGRAKVLDSPYEKPLNKGDILVTKATEPSWTPVFVNAVGVVLEVGGPLQHGAIIAREYGIPCVSGIQDVKSLIKDGDLLMVDGSNGIVKILE